MNDLEFNILEEESSTRRELLLDSDSLRLSEKLFSLQDYLTRGPEVLKQEFRDIQDEAYKVNKDFLNILSNVTDSISKGDVIETNIYTYF